MTRLIKILLCSSLFLIGCGAEHDDLLRRTDDLISGYGNCPTIDDTQACVCTAANWGGNCAVVRPGPWYTMNFFPTIGNDTISSVVVGGSVRLRLYEQGGFQYNFQGGFLSSPTFYWDFLPRSAYSYVGDDVNDKTSSMRLDYTADNCAAPLPNQAVYFAEGNASTTPGDCVVRPVGSEYNTANAFGLANDTISSVRTPQGVFITLCKNNDYLGGCRDFGSATMTLPVVTNMPSDWNDVASSLTIHN